MLFGGFPPVKSATNIVIKFFLKMIFTKIERKNILKIICLCLIPYQDAILCKMVGCDVVFF
jgi:hypothetical protein